MHWQDTGIILAAKRFGESSLKLDVLTTEHGKAAGMVKGGASKKRKHEFDIGNIVQVSWRGRLSEQLGQFTVELTAQPAASCLSSPLGLAALNASCALAHQCLPEYNRETALYERTRVLLERLSTPPLELLSAYIWFEVALLTASGFPLDLSHCAATGQAEDLCYLSPKSGRAVSQEAGAPYHDKLFALPSFMLTPGEAAVQMDEIRQAFLMMNYFLDHVATDMLHKPLAEARSRLLEECRKAAAQEVGMVGHNSKVIEEG